MPSLSPPPSAHPASAAARTRHRGPTAVAIVGAAVGIIAVLGLARLLRATSLFDPAPTHRLQLPLIEAANAGDGGVLRYHALRSGLTESEEAYRRSHGPRRQRPRVFLVAVTTCNRWQLTQAALDNLSSLDDPIDVVVIDDASEDGTAERARAMGFAVVAAAAPVGLTAGWNAAYRLFMEHPEYEALFIVNNDIIFPNTSFVRMADALQQVSGPAVVGPMTTRKGLGISFKHAKEQNLEAVLTIPDPLLEGLPHTAAAIQTLAATQYSKPPHYTKAGWLLGYCMGVDHEISSVAHSRTQLFSPKNKVIGQEDRLFEHLKVPAYAVTNAFVFHHKGGTLTSQSPSRENILACHEQPGS